MRQTSIEAYRKIKEEGLLSKARLDVYKALYECGPATAMEIFNFMAQRRGNKVAANVYARLSELRSVGVVRELGTVNCSTTKMNVIQWDVTNKLPIKLDKKKHKQKCLICHGTGYFEI